MTDLSPTSRRAGPRRLMKVVAAAAIAAPAGYFLGQFLARVFPDAGPLAGWFEAILWPDVVAGLLALSMAAASLIIFLFARSPDRAARLLALPEAASPGEMRLLRRQAIICLLSALALVLPFVLPAGGVAPLVALILIAAIMAFHSVLNLRLYRDSDEMLRAVTTEAAMKTFWIGQGGLFLWAAAERVGVAPDVTAWGVYVALMGLYLVIGAVVTAKRGLA